MHKKNGKMILEGTTVFADASRARAWHFDTREQALAFMASVRRAPDGSGYCRICNGPHVYKHGRP